MVLGGWSMLTQLKPQDPKNGKTFEAFAIGGSVAQVASLACGVWVVRWWVWGWWVGVGYVGPALQWGVGGSAFVLGAGYLGLGWPDLAVRGRWVGVRDWLVGGSGGEFGVVGDLRLGLVGRDWLVGGSGAEFGVVGDLRLGLVGRGLWWKVLGVVGWSWSVMVGAFGLGVGGLGLVSGGLCFWVWGWWVEVGQWWVVRLGLGLVGWGWLVVVCEGRFGVGGLGLGSGGLCFWVSGWWVGGGRSWSALAGMEWVGWGRSVVDGACGLVGWGWSVLRVWRWWVVGLCSWVWGGCVGVDQCWFVPVGLGLVGWSMLVCACGFGVGGLGSVGPTRRAMLPDVGPSSSDVGPSWGYVGPSCGYIGPSSGLCGPSLELYWPILGRCWPVLRPMLAHLGAMLAHLEAYVGPSWPILNHKIWKMGKNGMSTKHRKTRQFLAGKGVGGRGRGPSLLRRGEKQTPSAMPRPGGPWPDLSAYARQPARGPTMLAHSVAMLAYVGLSCGQCGPILWLCWPMLASCWPMLSQKIRKMGTAKKTL